MPDPGYGALISLIVFIAASVWLGTVAQRVVEKGEFLKGYFLGNRSLGSWALALTATVQSGGTFMGFPSLVYSHGWIVALWISSYMMVPISGFGVVGKRVAQLSRRTGAITMPDLFRERFGSSAIGIVSSLFIMFFMTFMMVAQFKAGALIMKVAWPGSGVLAFAEDTSGTETTPYYVGLVVFTLTVVGYTLIGGFLAAVWTDLFQSVMMFVGVVGLLVLSLIATGGLENATRKAIANTSPKYALAPGYAKPKPGSTSSAKPDERTPAQAAQAAERAFLPIGLALSAFIMWPFTGFASPASVVRVMACRDTATIRRSIVLLSVYNSMIYVPLIIICVCARALLPDLDGKSDEVVPRMALLTTSSLPGGSLFAGLILAAPFGAVLSTVSSYLVVIASGLVRDIYQRFIRPDATGAQLQRLSHILMISVGAIALLANIKPATYLQAIVVFSSTGAAATFVVPVLLSIYWRRATAPGMIAGMVAGASTVLAMFIIARFTPDPLIGPATSFRPYFLFGIEPLSWGIGMSLISSVLISLLTSPPSAELVSRQFDVQPVSPT